MLLEQPISDYLHLHLVKNVLAVKLETIHKPVKPPNSQPNHPQTSQTTQQPAKLVTNHPQTSHKLAKPTKPPTNQPETSQPIHNKLTRQPNHPKISQILEKPPTNQPIIIRKSAFYVTKNFSNNAKHVLNLQPFYSISLTFTSEYQSQVRIEEKWREII